MKSLFVLLISLMTNAAWSLPANWNPRSPLQYRSSAHWLLMDPAADDVERINTRECVTAVRRYLARGENFNSELMKRNTISMAALNARGVPVRPANAKYFHWSNSAGLLAQVQRHDYESIFTTFRMAETRRGLAPLDIHIDSSNFYLYVAADELSSSSYGTMLFSVQFDPRDRVFTPMGEATISTLYPGDDYILDRRRLIISIENEFVQKDPALRECRSAEPEAFDNGVQSLLITLAAEASGVSAIAYYGVNNYAYSGPPSPSIPQWIQIVGPWAIKDMKFERHN